LVEFFYRSHDPTTSDSQGPDFGTRTFSCCLCALMLQWLTIRQNIDQPSLLTRMSRRRSRNG
jgi:peptide methionine sulfoxide reductase MsrA